MALGFHFSCFALLTWTGLAGAAEPVAQPPVIIRQALLPPSPAVASPAALPQVPSVAVASPIEKLPEPDKSLNADQLDGLRKAVQILETANRHEAAAELRHKITEFELEQLKQLLAEKTASLSELQAEMEQLRTPAKLVQVTLSFRMLELSHTKLRDIGFDVSDLNKLFDERKDGAFNFVDDSEKVDCVINALQRDNIARMVAEPTLTIACGRAATFHSGGAIEIPLPRVPGDDSASRQLKKIGTSIDANPSLLEDGRLKLDFCIRHSELDPTCNAHVDGRRIPGIRARGVAQTVALRSGQTLIVSGLHQQRNEATTSPDGEVSKHTNDIELIVLVRPTYQLPEKESAK